MNFDYNLYYRGCLIVPCVLIIFVVVVLVAAMVPFIKKLFLHTVKPNDVVKLILLLLVCVILSFGKISILANGGLQLLNESESDAIILEGEIQEVVEIGGYFFPNFGSKYDEASNGFNLTINGTKCTMPIKGEFDVGDDVRVSYLPRSGYVLSIEKIV